MNILLRLSGILMRSLYFLLYPLFWIKSRGKTVTVPKLNDDLLKISATDLAEKIRNKEISSEKICKAYIKRIQEVNPIINAVVEERFESALKDARNVDTYLQTSSALSNEELRKIKPLLGVPLTVKESCSLAGLSHSGGTLGRAGIKAHIDGDAVSKLRASGAIPLLVSNTPELCLSWEARNFITGITNNPFDVSRTSGGSSGGEGALLGSGASLIGIGSDIAGSIRVPAMFNGIFGHKPTPSTVSLLLGHYPYSSHFLDYLVVGPMTRYAKDLALMTKIMCNGKASLLNLDEKVDLREVKVHYSEELGKSFLIPPVQDEIKTAIRRAAIFLKTKSGCQLEDNFICTGFENSLEISGSILFGLQDIPNLLKGENQNLLLEVCKCLLGTTKFTFNLLAFYTVKFIYKAFVMKESYYKENQQLQEKLSNILKHNGVLLCPTFPTSTFKHNCSLLLNCGLHYTTPANTLGFPATQVPCGFDKNGLPIGFQILAAPNQDRLCFAIAQEIEKCFGGWAPPSG